jgi:hypothetical protein
MRGEAADVHAEVSVEGDVVGQIAIGNNILQIGSLHGDLIMPASQAATPNPILRASPVKVVPRRPKPFFGRRAETTLLVTEARAGRAIAIEGPSGIGRSTLLRHLATADALHSVVYLPRLDLSVDDAVQVLFDHFYDCNVPLRPTAAQARLLLQQVQATIVVDDIAGDTAQALIDLAPNCGFVLAPASSPVAGVRSLPISGLAADEARALFEHSLGRQLRADEQDAADRLCMSACNFPTRVIATAAAARGSDRSLATFADGVWASTTASSLQPTADQTLLLDLLAAVSDLIMPESWLSTLAGVSDVAASLDQLAAGGFVREVTDTGYQLIGDRVAPADARSAVISHAVDVARVQRRPMPPGPTTDALHAVFTDCTIRGDWQAVLDIGAALDPAYAQSGRWDAWRDVLTPTLNAARALGNRAAEAKALHQLGTRELCLLSFGAAASLLAVALRIRRLIGDTAGAEATRHNISLIPPVITPDAGVQPPGTPFRPRLRAAAAAGTALVTTLTTTVAVSLTNSPPIPTIPLPSISFTTTSLVFPEQPVSSPGQTRTATLVNDGQTIAHISAPRTTGTDTADFEVTATTCGDELPAGSTCDTTVAFIPSAQGVRTALLTVDLDGVELDTPITLAGQGSAPTGLILDPTTLDFPAQRLGTTSRSRAITVTHPAPGTTTVDQVVVEGTGATAFALVGDTCSGRLIASTDPCAVQVQFAPTTTPGTQAARLKFVADDGTIAASVPLRGAAAVGTGTAGAPPLAARPASPPPPRAVVVPQLVGEPIGTARDLLTAAGLKVGAVDDVPDDSAPPGQVIGSSPAAGTQVEPDTVIALVTSSGPQTCVVPDVTGQGLDLAKATIESTCAAVGAVRTELRIEGETDIVIRTNPQPGAQITKGEPVELTVARDGRRIPNVVGMSLSAAKAAIETAGLVVGAITRTNTSSEGAVVTSSSPGPRKLVEFGSEVDLTVGDEAPQGSDGE